MRVRWSTAGGLANKQAELMKIIEISQIKKQIEVLLTFMPDEILYLPMEELGKVHKFVGVLLFADVSGFTPLTEKYNKTGKGGIYKLTATLNAYIGAIVEVIYYFGGDVLKFSGDAFLALWKAPSDECLYAVIHEAIVCALFIQKTLGFFETEVNVLLKVKLAISCGNLTVSVIGDEKFKHYVILGQAINDVKAAEHVSVSGDVVVSPSAWGHLAEENYDVTHALGGNVKVWQCTYKPSQREKEKQYKERFKEISKLCQQHIELRNALHQNKKLSENITDSYLIEKFVQSLPPRKTMKIAVQQWIMKELSPFIIKPVLEQVEEMQPLQYLTEMREVTIQFINIVPSTFDENRLVVMVDSAYKIVCNITSDVLGVVNKVSLFDKDAMMLVLFGLKGVGHELESQNALKSAYQIRREIVKLEDVKSVSVGITHGLVYCGVEEMQPLQYLTEMREVTIQFINIVPSTFDENRLVVMVDSAYKIVCNITSDVLGVVNKVSLFDKDAMMLVLFGLKGVGHELESQNALKSAYQIRREIVKLKDVKSVSVGITHGLVYCGVVGHPLRKEYTVIGGPVNKAARIMCAYEHKVTCDYETYTNSKLSSTYFQLQSAYKLKGIENAGNIFEYNENFEEEGRSEPQNVPLIGRTEEIGFIEEILAGEHSFTGVLFKGADKSGKTSLLEYFYDECLRRNLLSAFVALHEGTQRPYNCISLIYRQIFDRLSSLQRSTSSLEDFKRNIWNFNEILQEKLVPLPNEVTDRRKSISESFREICGSNQTVIIVDNVQFLDLRSFEIIDEVLKTGSFRLICAGSFSENTWDTLFQFSLTDRVKVVDLAPLESCWIAPLICRFLKVVGVPKRLVYLVEKSCEGRPGWIQSCLLKLVNNSGIKIEYVLPDISMQDWVVFPPNEMTTLELLGMGQEYFQKMLSIEQVVPIVVFTKDKNETVKDLTLAAISLDLFDSFTPYEQLIIKTAAVLGVTFTRTLLVIMLKYPNMQTFNHAMRHLFEEGVFDCGTKYISSGGRYSRQTTCYCYMTLDHLELEAVHQNLPKYSYCKNLHFKNGTLRSVAYELIPANQRKELHLKTTEILENQNNSCPNCLRDDSPLIFQFHKFSRMAQESEGRISRSGFGVSSQDDNVATENIKDVIRANIEMQYSEPTAVSVFVPSRKVWDPTVCFCLEILTRVYGDLVYHSGQAGHGSKTIFFLYQNGLILSLLDELEDAVEVLKEASELCIRHIYARSRVKLSFAKYIFAKICSLLAEIHFSLNNWKAAKNYCMLTLRQFDVPMTSLFLTGRVKIFNRLFADHKRLNQHSRDSIGKCLSVVSRIFAAEGKWSLAIGVATKSLQLVKYSNPNVELLCDVYSTALDMHCFRDDAHVCEQLVRNLGQELTRLYGNNLTSEIFAVAKLMYVVFQVKAKAGALVVATRMGFRLFELNRLLHAYVFQLEMIPILCFLLICQKRLDDVVFTAKYLKNMGKKYDHRGETAYYAISLMMLSETNFYLEPMEDLEAYAEKLFVANKTTTYQTPLQDTLALYVISNLLKKGKTGKASKWRQFHCNSTETSRSFFGFWNRLKYTENTLILLCKDTVTKTNVPDFMPQKIKRLLRECGRQIEVWKVFAPRYLHCVAYYKKLRGKRSRAMEVLKEAAEEARKAENVLEECWIALNENYWKGDYYWAEGKEPVFWRTANFYGKEDWSQIMNVLPLP